ncbi:Dot/Icm T4SS effector AnkQ/LegA10 [Legionella bozemanae]|uniref:Ankyrin repeat-containing protein n=1 Tax=Legionella bozemanae TaxID=447 RepID=A0A0W0RQV5_LEGBO|nr:Dot/Icm T4SS effector AnkQ/LegA10 [Legionella bozemanae]KTC73456.1 ankyrin repeat-containing protein [Legionella bozemanae]STO32982.1 Ankyrin repeats (3 copies) [Legionella bozemanae]
MASSQVEVKKILLSDKMIALVNKPDVHFDEIETLVGEELTVVPGGKALDQLTDFIHLVSFIKARRFSNPVLALQVFINENTSQETRKALIKAIGMAPARDDKIYELICFLAKKDTLTRYTQITHVTPLRFTTGEGELEYTEECSDWYLIFDLFGLSKSLPSELIPLIAELLTTTNPSVEDFRTLEKFLKFVERLDLLRNDIIEAMLPQLRYKNSIEKLQTFLGYLQSNDFLHPTILKHTLPLLHHLDALKIFFNAYLQELKSVGSCQETLRKLTPFCQLSLPEKGSYDDVVSTNTPLHQAIIERNLFNLEHALSLANSKLLLATSYDNTALLLACKLADKEAAKHILEKMRELKCNVNQTDHHGMTALHWARFYHFDDLSMELIEAGANEELKATNGKNCAYFVKHQFTLTDFKIEGREIVDDFFKLKNCALTDIAFHADKIALNLKLTTSKEVMDLYHNDEIAQIRSSNRFFLFFKTFRTRLVEWLGKQRELDYQSSSLTAEQRVVPS